MKFYSQRAYTLLEMAMVLGIIALSAMVIVPRVAGFVNAWTLETEVNKVKAKVFEAQQSAIAEQCQYRVTFPMGMGTTYTISKNNGSGWILLETLTLTNNVSFTTTTWSPFGRLDFDQFGAPVAGGSVWLSHQITSKFKQLNVQAVTGKITIS